MVTERMLKYTCSVFQHQITMTQYKKEFPFPVLFPPVTPKNVLAEWLSIHSVPQFHCAGRYGFKNTTSSVQNIISIFFADKWQFLFHAETEKYAHVTFFFNGGVEKQFEGETRCMVPSPKVATYDLKPEMSAAGVGEEVKWKVL